MCVYLDWKLCVAEGKEGKRKRGKRCTESPIAAGHLFDRRHHGRDNVILAWRRCSRGQAFILLEATERREERWWTWSVACRARVSWYCSLVFLLCLFTAGFRSRLFTLFGRTLLHKFRARSLKISTFWFSWFFWAFFSHCEVQDR